MLSICLCGVASMNDMTAPSVSLEGKSLWLMQSLPVTPWQVLKAKLSMQIILTAVPMALCIVVRGGSLSVPACAASDDDAVGNVLRGADGAVRPVSGSEKSHPDMDE